MENLFSPNHNQQRCCFCGQAFPNSHTVAGKELLEDFWRYHYPNHLRHFDTEVWLCKISHHPEDLRWKLGSKMQKLAMINLYGHEEETGRAEKKIRRKENSSKEKSRRAWGRWRGGFLIARGAPESCLMMTHGKTNCGSNGLRPQLEAHRLLLPCCVKLQWCGETPEEGALVCLKCILVLQE